jgi:hypothetical protein
MAPGSAGRRALALAFAALAAAARAETPLYETGPGQDAAFVRFVNATGAEVRIAAARGGAKFVLAATAGGRASSFHPIVAGARQRAIVSLRGREVAIEVHARPGEYLTVAVGEGGDGVPRTQLLRESPSDYTAARASIALLNADPACAAASLSGGPANLRILEGVRPYAVARRVVNPVRLAAQLDCAGEGAVAVDLGQLQAGERYSVILIATPSGRIALHVVDRVL